MKERILLILQNKHLTSAKLADVIQVQRSSISHILSGRNKPSMDFMQKLLDNFPDISGDWLITGKGEMYKVKQEPPIDLHTSEVRSSVNQENAANNNLFNIPEKERHQSKEDIQPKKEVAKTPGEPLERIVNKKIKRIIIYYDDHSYEELFPNGN